MRYDERLGLVLLPVFLQGWQMDMPVLLSVCGLPDTQVARIEITDAIHWIRMNRCRELKRELVTDRSENLYFMPAKGEWRPLVESWLGTVIKDSNTRLETVLEMVEVWRLNHGGSMPDNRIFRRVNAIVRMQKGIVASGNDIEEDLQELIESLPS